MVLKNWSFLYSLSLIISRLSTVYNAVRLSYSEPLVNSVWFYPEGIATHIVTSDFSVVNDIINQFSCEVGSTPTYTNSSINLSSGTTFALSYPFSALGWCTLQVTSAPPGISTPYPSVTFKISATVTITSSSTLIAGVDSIVNVSTSNPNGSLDTFSLSLICGPYSQNFTGNYNDPLTITPATNMTSRAECLFYVPSNGVYEAGLKIGITVLGTIEFFSVTPDPVIANTTLALQLTTSDNSTISTVTTLSCNAGNTSVTSSSMSFTLPVPSFYIGNCSLSTVESTIGEAEYVQITPTFITINGYMNWITPSTNSYLISGQSQLILVNSSSSAGFAVQINLGDNLYLGSSETNVSQFYQIPINIPRGKTGLSAIATQDYFNSPSNISVFINTTVSFLTPTNGGTFLTNAAIPVQLIADDGELVTGQVQMICSDGFTSTQTVSSLTFTNFYSSTQSGTCLFTIINLDTLFTTKSSTGSLATLSTITSPTSGPLVFLTDEEKIEFISKITFTPTRST